MQHLIVFTVVLYGAVIVKAQISTCIPGTKPSVGSNRNYVLASHKKRAPIVEYLNDIVGSAFEPPISFSLGDALKYLETDSVEGSKQLGFDFSLTNAYRSSCIESEMEAVPIANQVVAHKLTNNATKFGAVLYTLKNNTEITSVEDIKGKILGTNRISSLATQLCFHVLRRHGVHHLQDPKQTIFFDHSKTAADALLEGRVDVACGAVNILEKHKHPATGEQLNLDDILVLDPQIYTNENNGLQFPFLISSPLVPSPLLLAYPHVEDEVVALVQHELFALRQHADSAPALLACMEERGCFANETQCVDDCFGSLPEGTVRDCATTATLALKAFEVIKLTDSVGFFKPQNNHLLRDIEEETGFLLKDPDPRCIRLENIEEAVTCPKGHFVRTSDEIVLECVNQGLDCYDEVCFCKPCVQAFEVDFFPSGGGRGVGSGCEKFSICGTVQQEDSILFKAIDNKGRVNSTITGSLLVDKEGHEETFLFEELAGEFEFEFVASSMKVGQRILKVEVNGEEIPESPFRIAVVERDCGASAGFQQREPDLFGDCVCRRGYVEFGDKCVSLATLLSSILIPLFLFCFLAVWCHLRVKREQADSMWKVDESELLFSSEPTILGRGAFGKVLLAEYRGTKVAVKRALPVVKGKRQRSKEFDFESIRASRSSSSGPRRRFSNANSQMRSDFIREMRHLSKLRHPCITTVMGAVLNRKSEPMLVMEYMHFGSLYDLLHNESIVLEGKILIGMLRDVASGVRYLHSSKPCILHGDLKSANVLVDDKFRAKVSDFGLSHNGYYDAANVTGTPYWMAPELLRGESSNTTASDMFSLGIILYEVISREEPYTGEVPEIVLLQVMDETVKRRPPVPKSCSGKAAELMMACLEENPEQRPTAAAMDVALSLLDGSSVEPTDLKSSNTSSSTERLLEQVFPPHIADALKHGRKIEPETHDSVTVAFSDIVGYTKIASELSPTKVSDLLHRLYVKFDELCDQFDVFKVETVGDAYMTVTNLMKNQEHHASVAARFAIEAMKAASKVRIDIDDQSAGFVQVRFGFHTGPVVGHVIGTRNPRFSLIGDTVNTASRMESTSKPGFIQCSEDSYRLLCSDPNVSDFYISSRGVIHVKGKGDMCTYFIESNRTAFSNHRSQKLVEWCANTLLKFVEAVVRCKEETTRYEHQHDSEGFQIGSVDARTVQSIPFVSREQNKTSMGKVAAPVREQVHLFVSEVERMYPCKNDFHNFEHASHVAMSAVNMLENLPPHNGLKSDPLAQSALLLACLAHDVEHPGVSNAQCVHEKTDLALLYQYRCVAEQNSIDVVWTLFLNQRYEDLREALCPSTDHLRRLYDLFVKAMLATDISDKKLNKLRKETWQEAFQGVLNDEKCIEIPETRQRCQANVTLELIMQAADISHTMQPWEVYRKWNCRLFTECTEAHNAGRKLSRIALSPYQGWFEGEMGFFDYVVVPLAMRMQEVGFAASYLELAKANRQRWECEGRAVLAEYAAISGVQT